MNNLSVKNKDKDTLEKVVLSETLSWKAKGILSWFYANSNRKIRVTIQLLVDEHKGGKHLISTGLKELRKTGYLTIEQYRDSSGRIAGYYYTVNFLPNRNAAHRA